MEVFKLAAIRGLNAMSAELYGIRMPETHPLKFANKDGKPFKTASQDEAVKTAEILTETLGEDCFAVEVKEVIEIKLCEV